MVLVEGCHNSQEVESVGHSVVTYSVTPEIVAHQTPLSMEFSRQEYWSGQTFPSPGDLLDPGVEPRSPTLQTDSLPSELPGKPLSQLQKTFIFLQQKFQASQPRDQIWGLLHCRQILYCLNHQGRPSLIGVGLIFELLDQRSYSGLVRELCERRHSTLLTFLLSISNKCLIQ